MTSSDLFVLFPTETLPQGRIESILGFYVEMEPRQDHRAHGRPG